MKCCTSAQSSSLQLLWLRWYTVTRLSSEALAAFRSTDDLFIALVPRGRLKELRFSECGAEPGSHAVWVDRFVCLEFLRWFQSQLFTSRRHSALLLFSCFFNALTLWSCVWYALATLKSSYCVWLIVNKQEIVVLRYRQHIRAIIHFEQRVQASLSAPDFNWLRIPDSLRDYSYLAIMWRKLSSAQVVWSDWNYFERRTSGSQNNWTLTKQTCVSSSFSSRESCESEDAVSLPSSYPSSPTENGTVSTENHSRPSSKSTLEENAYEDITGECTPGCADSAHSSLLHQRFVNLITSHHHPRLTTFLKFMPSTISHKVTAGHVRYELTFFFFRVTHNK